MAKKKKTGVFWGETYVKSKEGKGNCYNCRRKGSALTGKQTRSSRGFGIPVWFSVLGSEAVTAVPLVTAVGRV